MEKESNVALVEFVEEYLSKNSTYYHKWKSFVNEFNRLVENVDCCLFIKSLNMENIFRTVKGVEIHKDCVKIVYTTDNVVNLCTTRNYTLNDLKIINNILNNLIEIMEMYFCCLNNLYEKLGMLS